ncbi:MAG: tetratricopeptide repeat protein, partial [Terriglobus roseus]|nr:tetratricopeptide repeat protein [Terriglobus roseus]
WVYYHKQTYSMARDLLEDAAQQAPNDANIQYHLGATYAKLNDKANALLHLKQAVTLAPDSRAGKSAAAAIAQLG